MTKLLILLFFFLNMPNTYAETLKLEVGPGEQLIIKAAGGKLKLTSTTAKEVQVNIKGPSSMFASPVSLEKEKGVVYMRVKGSKDQLSKLEVDVASPQMPAKLYWQKGSVQVKNWESSLSVVMDEGAIALESGKGPAKLILQKGQIFVKKHQGAVDIDSYKASVQVDEHKGALNIENFLGKIELNKIQGNMKLSLYKGSIKSKQTKGSLEFYGERAKMSFLAHEGVLKGKAGQGSLAAQLKGAPSVHIRSREASVTIKTGPATGARVDLGTTKAYLAIPGSIRRSRRPNMLMAQGRLFGSGRGRIFVRTESGNIKLH